MRNLQQADAPELARLIQTIWPHNNPNIERIARVSLENNHCTLVERDGERLVGFVDAFTTGAQNGALRWEIDLLGVHPDHRGRGIAQVLVGAAIDAGRRFGAGTLRALVKVDNSASLNTFRRCGFASDEATYDLCISDQVVTESVAPAAGTHFVSVSTLTYGGIWIEGAQTPESLRGAQAIRTRYGWDVAGAVIPTGTHAAESLGYEIAGQYRWLRL